MLFDDEKTKKRIMECLRKHGYECIEIDYDLMVRPSSPRKYSEVVYGVSGFELKLHKDRVFYEYLPALEDEIKADTALLKELFIIENHDKLLKWYRDLSEKIDEYESEVATMMNVLEAQLGMECCPRCQCAGNVLVEGVPKACPMCNGVGMLTAIQRKELGL